MISYTTRVEGNKFIAKFDVSPKDVKCSRGNYTAIHKGAGTTSRYGIWEGVQLVSVYGRVNSNNPWVNLNNNPKPEIYTTENGNSIQIKATYRIKTMGYHWQCTNGSIPFFYYGNIGGDPNRYVNGYFTDARATSPGANLHSIHAIVPKDWKHIGSDWSDWAYKHGQSTSHWAFDHGRYEQRNGNVEGANSGNGWISDAGYAQAWRKSCMFTFEKEFTASVTSSGISIEATAPDVYVEPTKGDSGKVKLTYRGASPGKFKLKAYCKDKEAIIDDFPISGTQGNGGSWTYTIDFMKHFGENYRGNDITYEAWAKNQFDKVSGSSGKKGGHRFNGRPSIPNGLFVSGRNDLIYDKITFSWNKCTDPENDYVVYDLWLKAVKADGTVLRDNYLVRGFDGLKYDYDIANNPDNTQYILKVRSSDQTITSDWSTPLEFKKGSKPTGILNLISPVIDETVLYSDAPRFAFKGYDSRSTMVVVLNGIEYDSKKNADLFCLKDDKAIFKKNLNGITNIKIQAYLKNEYGTSDKSAIYTFTRKTPFENVQEDNVIKAIDIKAIQNQIIDKAKAYNIKSNIEIVSIDNYIKAKDYNSCVDCLKAINDSINNIINNDTFDVTLISKKVAVGDYPDDVLWDNLIKDIKNI